MARTGRHALALVLLLATAFVTFIGQPASSATEIPEAAMEAILADGQFVYGPNVGSFAVEAYLQSRGSPLSEYASAIEDQASYYSINPRVLLAVIELQTGVVTRPVAPAALNQLFDVPGAVDFTQQLAALAETLATHFYERLYGSPSKVAAPVLANGGNLDLVTVPNAASYALMATLDPAPTRLQLQAIVDNTEPTGFYQTYKRLFPESDPLDTSNDIIPPETPPSDLFKFPFALGDRWRFSGGPHARDGCTDNPFSAIDFAPGAPDCTVPTDRWITSPAEADVLRVSCGGCNVVLSFRDTGGWEGRFYHVANPVVAEGDIVSQNGRIGNPSQWPDSSCDISCGTCRGFASGVHAHFDLKYNGAYVPIEGAAFEGWVVHGTTCYDGYLEKGLDSVDAGTWLTSLEPPIGCLTDGSCQYQVSLPTIRVLKTVWLPGVGGGGRR